MPWSISEHHDECPSDESWAVVKDDTDEVVGCHSSNDDAKSQLAALNAAEADEERSLVSRLIEHIRAFFSPPPEEPKEQAISSLRLYEQVWAALDRAYPEEWPWLTDFYVDDDGSMFAIFAAAGKIFRTDFTIQDEQVELGERIQVTETFTPVTSTRIFRQADGRHRWISISATSTLNRCAEIDSRDLFDSFVAHARETGEYPYRCFCHRGEEFTTGQADFLARDGNCYISSGIYDDTELARMEIAARQKEPDYWGDSIGYNPTTEPEMASISGIEIPVYRSGINAEISTLPEGMAAAWFTSGSIMEVNMKRQMNDLEFGAFVKLFDDNEEQARAWLEENVDPTNRTIEEREMVTRENGENGAEPEPTPDTSQLTEAIRDKQELAQVFELDDAAIAAIVERMNETGLNSQLEAMTESLADLARAIETIQRGVATQVQVASEHTKRLEALERDEGDKQDSWVKDLPPRVTMPIRVTHRPSVAHSRRQTEPASSDLAARAEGTLANMRSTT